MLLHGVGRRLATLLAGILLVVTGMVAASAPANAQERNLVIFGDSIIADTPSLEYLADRFGSSTSSGSSGSGDSSVGHCATSPDNFGARAARKLNLAAWDYSCPGTTSISPGTKFSTQVDRALATGGLTPAAQRVVVTTGFNDTYNNDSLPAGEVRSRFVGAMAPQIERIKAAAPNARIQIVGYATITDGDFVCLAHIGANIHDRTFFPRVGYWEWLAQDMQRDLAHATGTEFVDLKPATADNGMCAPDDRRMWAGLIDFHGGPGNMPIHINARGHEHVAGVIAAS